MKKSRRPTRVRPAVAVALVVLLAFVLASVTFARSTVLNHLVALGVVAPVETYDNPQGVLTVLVTSTGFPEDEITVRAGMHRLMLINRTGLRDLDFVVSRPGKDALLRGGGKYVKGDVPLAPGEVIITEASHPEWVCRITVEP
jgi:hypothetical protein